MEGDPINVDANMIYTSTHEEHVAAQFQTPAGAELEKVWIMVKNTAYVNKS